jgi:hypothetical protein
LKKSAYSEISVVVGHWHRHFFPVDPPHQHYHPQSQYRYQDLPFDNPGNQQRNDSDADNDFFYYSLLLTATK